MQGNKRKLAEAIFSVRTSYRELTTAQNDAAIVFNDLLCLVNGFREENAEYILQQINQDVKLFSQYRDLVRQRHYDQSLSLAAASSGSDLPVRQTDKFVLKFKRDRMVPSQIFAILLITHPSERHSVSGVVINIFSQDICERIHFPAVIDGHSQLLFEQDDPKLKLLLDANAEISIMR